MLYAVLGTAAGFITAVFLILFISVMKAQKITRRYKAKMKAAGETEEKQKLEFSKILAVWAALVATVVIVASVTLAAFDKQPVSDLAIAVFTACIGYLVTYAGKSAFEKSSRNKHRLDENGKPFEYYESTEKDTGG